MINDSYRQKVAEYYYNLGREHYALKQAAPLATLGLKLDAGKAAKQGVTAGTEKRPRGKTKPSIYDRVLKGGVAAANSIVSGYLDPRLPKNESMGEAAYNTVSDLASIVSNPLTAPAPIARAAQRYGRMLDRTTKSMQKRFDKGGTDRKQVEEYFKAHPKFNP